MKKKILYLAVTTALVLSSCSNDETTAVNQGEAISFRSSVSGVTRASSVANVTTANIPSFTVNAMNAGTESSYFSDAVFTRVSETSTFTSGTKYYWPPTGSLDFYAYSPAGNSQVTYTNYKSFTITPTSGTDPANQVDFVYAATKGKNRSTSASGVSLNFRHTGAKIVCKVQNSSANMKFGIEGWKIGYLSPTGTFTFADTNTEGTGTLTAGQWGTLAAAAVSTEYSSTFTKVDIAASAAATALDGEMILIPQALTAATGYASSDNAAKLNGTFIAIKLYIKDNSNNNLIAGGGTTEDPTTIWAIWPIGGHSWEPGKKYTYTVNLAGGGFEETNKASTDANLDPILQNAEITFVNVTVDEWNDYYYDVPTISYAYAENNVAGTYSVTNIAGSYSCEITGLTASKTYNLSEESAVDWLSEPASITSDANGKATLTFTVTANTGNNAARNATIILTQSDNGSNKTKVTVSQAKGPTAE